jgi:farnesyl-diphosphate farnesyltransferase
MTRLYAPVRCRIVEGDELLVATRVVDRQISTHFPMPALTSPHPVVRPLRATPRSAREVERWCRAILPRVSRTFALSVRVLPGDLGRAVLAAYLLCRIADTIEDAPTTPADEKAATLDRLLRCFDDPAEATPLAESLATLPGDAAHVELAANTDHVFALFRALPPASQGHVRKWVEEMVVGMRKFVLLYPHGIRIQTIEEYKEYCYYVAGTVGYMLTDLWHEHSHAVSESVYRRLREKSRAFGEALQTVNILKDVATDAEQENAIYIPDAHLRAHGSGHATILSAAHQSANHAALTDLVKLAWADLEDARRYLLMVPRRAWSIRTFCVWPLLFAFATLRDLTQSRAMLTKGGVVKITRAEVKSLLLLAPVLVWSNRAVSWLVERVRVRAFRVA